jgi:hypothetical protein
VNQQYSSTNSQEGNGLVASRSNSFEVAGDTVVTTSSDVAMSTTSSVARQGNTDPKADLSQVVALLKDNATAVKKQSGLDVNTNEGLGKAVMQYWKENKLDPKDLKEQLPNIKDSEFATASKALTDSKVTEPKNAKQSAPQR